MTSTIPRTSSKDASVTAYEALRTHVLTGVPGGGHGGLIMLLRQGVAAWMSRRSTCFAPTPPEVHDAVPFVGDEVHAAMVRVLASMALAGRMEARA